MAKKKEKKRLGPKVVPFPASSIAKAKNTARQLFCLGQEAEQHDNTAAALQYYKRAVALDPDADDALVNVGTIHLISGNTNLAQKYYQEALKANQGSALAHFNLGNCASLQGKRAQAISHFLKALALCPTYSDAHFNLAIEYQLAGLGRNALIHYEQFLQNCGHDSAREYAANQLVLLKKVFRIHPVIVHDSQETA